jgi:transcriptional regulator with XRE-family HTH domain
MMVVKVEFGMRLRALRARAGLTQQQLAEMAGLHRQGIVKLERGEREPAWSTLLALADALNVGLQEFADSESSMASTTPLGRPRKPVAARRLGGK